MQKLERQIINQCFILCLFTPHLFFCAGIFLCWHLLPVFLCWRFLCWCLPFICADASATKGGPGTLCTEVDCGLLLLPRLLQQKKSLSWRTTIDPFTKVRIWYLQNNWQRTCVCWRGVGYTGPYLNMWGCRGGGGVLAAVATVEPKLFVEGAVKLSASLLFRLAFVSRGDPFSLSFPLSLCPSPSISLSRRLLGFAEQCLSRHKLHGWLSIVLICVWKSKDWLLDWSKWA